MHSSSSDLILFLTKTYLYRCRSYSKTSSLNNRIGGSGFDNPDFLRPRKSLNTLMPVPCILFHAYFLLLSMQSSEAAFSSLVSLNNFQIQMIGLNCTLNRARMIWFPGLADGGDRSSRLSWSTYLGGWRGLSTETRFYHFVIMQKGVHEIFLALTRRWTGTRLSSRPWINSPDDSSALSSA